MGHEGNKLIPKCDGYLGESENNNKGVFQGSPLSATLYIIYGGQMVKRYNTNLPQEIQNNTPPLKTRNEKMNTNGRNTNMN